MDPITLRPLRLRGAMPTEGHDKEVRTKDTELADTEQADRQISNVLAPAAANISNLTAPKQTTVKASEEMDLGMANTMTYIMDGLRSKHVDYMSVEQQRGSRACVCADAVSGKVYKDTRKAGLSQVVHGQAQSAAALPEPVEKSLPHQKDPPFTPPSCSTSNQSVI